MDILNTTKDGYKRWEDKKLNNFISQPDKMMVEIAEAESLKKSEKTKIKNLLDQQNIVFYEFKRNTKCFPRGKTLVSSRENTCFPEENTCFPEGKHLFPRGKTVSRNSLTG